MKEKEQQITPRQLEIMKLTGSYQSNQPYSATIQEIAQQIGISRATAFEHIAALRKKGLLAKSTGRARCLKLTPDGLNLLKNCCRTEPEHNEAEEGISLLGTVAAGEPIEAISNPDSISLSNHFGNTGNVFALCVRGESMKDADIHDGDHVICKKTAYAENGQLVIAAVDDGSVTLKKFYKESGRVRLQPANENFDPIYSDSCKIEAVVLGLVRKF